MRLPIPFQNAYGSTRVPVVSQETLNYYPHSKRGLKQFPGATLFSDTSVSGPRGMKVMGGVLYVILGTALYSINSGGAISSSLGQITGTGKAVMETDGVQLVITTGSIIYVYTVSGGRVVVTDSDVEDTAKSSAYLDLAFYLDQDNGNFIASANNDATSYSTDDKIEAESSADDILRMFSHNQLLYAFGESSTEIWYTVATGRPPITRQQVIERGIIGRYAIDSIDDTIFFVDEFTRPNMMSGLQYEPIYTAAIAEEWATYASPGDCFVSAYNWNQENFVEFTFPTAERSWVYHVHSGQWTRRSAPGGGDGQGFSEAVGYATVYGKLLSLNTNGDVVSYSDTVYRDQEVTTTRTKDTEVITSDIYGDASILGRRMICNSLRVTTQSTAAATLTITLSKDGGSFAQSRTMTLTAGLQTRELTAFGMFREGIFRIKTLTNAGVDIVDLAGDFEVLED